MLQIAPPPVIEKVLKTHDNSGMTGIKIFCAANEPKESQKTPVEKNRGF
jgi:hypothetical protein